MNSSVMVLSCEHRNIPMEQKTKTQIYAEYLAKQGFHPEVVDSELVKFKSEGRIYAILTDETDAEYHSIILPNIWPIVSQEERAKVQNACDTTNRTCKVAKLYTMDDNVWAVTEFFLQDPNDFQKIFSRLVSTIHSAVKNFSNQLSPKEKAQ